MDFVLKLTSRRLRRTHNQWKGEAVHYDAEKGESIIEKGLGVHTC